MAARQAKADATGKKPRGRDPQPPTPGPRKKEQVNLTDEESRIVPSSDKGYVQAYNAQASVDVDTMLIVEAHISQAPNDKQEIIPSLAALKDLPVELGQVDTILADAGYYSDKNVTSCEQADIVPFIPPSRDKHNQQMLERFTDPLPLSDDAAPIDKMRHKLKTPDGRKVYARRKSTVEPVFGIIKNVMGFRQFFLRGLDAVAGEWTLASIAWNIKRMFILNS